MKGQDTVKLVGLLVQCPALEHLDLSGNSDFGAGRAERFAGVLRQRQELVHLNLSGHWIEAGGVESLAGVLVECPALAHLNLGWQSDRHRWVREFCRSTDAVHIADSPPSPRK